MLLRSVTEEDLAGLAAGLARLPLMERYSRSAAKLEADLRAALARGDGLVGAEVGGRLVGFCWFLHHGTLGMGGYLRLIAVLDGAQGRGAGAALLAAYEAAVARGAAHAFLLVSDFNEPAQRFYERHGWTRVGAIPKLVLPDVDELVYWKRLR
ncbi:MAG TPA: GNAT family N-acetyltransferase [Anaeromyxobacteraceae bacterium]|nr:GNAT family N-acetyltransferase [Anaeromyxobacteraceae bacterium]